jgi:hypothetical protein
MHNKRLIFIVAVGLLMAVASNVNAGGISADAGLTPAQDKWIFRTSVRYTKLTNDPTMMASSMYMFPMVVAYGFRSDLTVMVRQPFMQMNMTMNGNSSRSSGFGDLMLMAKYRAVRWNTPTYTLGIAPLLGVKLPTGTEEFTADALALQTGLYISARRVPWASDLNVTYTINGLTGDDDREENKVLEMVGALAYQFSLTNDGRMAFAPVIEFSYENASTIEIDGVTQADTGESFFRIAPGMKLTISSVIIESLLWIPVWQDQNGTQLEHGVGGLFGVRVML